MLSAVDTSPFNFESSDSFETTKVDTSTSSGNNTADTSYKSIKKLKGYVGFANLPNQWYRRSVKKGFNFNLLVVGQSGLGKSTLINTLFNQNLCPPKGPQDPSKFEIKEEEEEEESKIFKNSKPKVPSINIETKSTIIEENDIRLNLSVVNTPGYSDYINNSNAWTPIIEEIESRFDSYLESESNTNRTSIPDTRIHACLYFIEPTGHSLKAIDIKMMKLLHEKVNLIPIISKSDTLTTEEVENFKRSILDDIKTQNIELFNPPNYKNEDEETILESQQLMSKVPFAIIGSMDTVVNAEGKNVRGRKYQWGAVEVENEEHCDFIKLRQMLVRSYMEELREKTVNILYENYRRERLTSLGIKQDDTVFREFNPQKKKQQEEELHQMKLKKMEAEMKKVFEKKVKDKEDKLTKSESDLFAKHQEMKNKLNREIKELQNKKAALEAKIEEPKPRRGFSLR